jgi:hypothetical protein
MNCPEHSRLQQLPSFRRGLYLHKKGGLYQALALAVEEATQTPVVIYQHIEGEQIGEVLWTRPLTSWNEIVEWPDGQLRPRFVWADYHDVLRQAEQCGTTTVDRIKSVTVEARVKRNEAEAQIKARRSPFLKVLSAIGESLSMELKKIQDEEDARVSAVFEDAIK